MRENSSRRRQLTEWTRREDCVTRIRVRTEYFLPAECEDIYVGLQELKMAAKGSGKKTDKYTAVFKDWDKNGDGYLTICELRDAFKSCGCKLTDSQIADTFVFFDGPQGDKRITLEEFTKGLEKIEEFISKLKAMFDQYDTDGSGFLDRAELTKLMTNSGQQFSESEITQILQDADKNGDNQISFKELLDACT